MYHQNIPLFGTSTNLLATGIMLSFKKSISSQGTLVFREHSVEVLAQILRPTVLKASVLLMTRNGQLG